MNPLSNISSFGAIDADFDELLDASFQDHEAYRSALSHDRFLVVGRKGAGKTAIFKKLIRTRQHDFFAFGHTFSDYPWHHHHLQESIGVPEELRYVHSWQFLILLTVAKLLLNQDQSQPWDEASAAELGKLESFVVDSYGSRDPDVTQIFTPSKYLRIKPHLKIPYVGSSLDLERLPVEHLPKILSDVARTIREAITICLNPSLNYYVCFDELDRGFDPSDDRYKRMLIGLILAAREVNQFARQADKRLSIVVFLREDIYQLLRFEDKNKITENSLSRIEWDSPKTKWTLKQLMERRFGATVSGESTVDWDKVFDESQEMPGRQTKYRHILDRTFRRPRDMIKFCNEVLTEYKKRRGAGIFANEDIVAARNAYSDYLLRELQDEVHKHVSNYDDYLEIVKSLDALQFSGADFAGACERRSDLVPSGETSASILRQLFEFSVVGYQRTGGVGGGSEYLYRYMDPTVRFDEAASNFRVHPGFMEAFGLKKFRRGE